MVALGLTVVQCSTHKHKKHHVDRLVDEYIGHCKERMSKGHPTRTHSFQLRLLYHLCTAVTSCTVERRFEGRMVHKQETWLHVKH